MSSSSLKEYYLESGLCADDFHIGPEHPGIEERAIDLLAKSSGKRVLEIGYQSGAFAAPVIEAYGRDDSFDYTGVDNFAFNNSIRSNWRPQFIEGYLASKNLNKTAYRFLQGDANAFLLAQREPYDLILIDHLKPLYARELRTILKRKLIKPDGVILVHDVAGRAKQVWRDCTRWCWCYHCESEIDLGVVSGLAIIRSKKGYKSRGRIFEIGVRGFEIFTTVRRMA